METDCMLSKWVKELLEKVTTSDDDEDDDDNDDDDDAGDGIFQDNIEPGEQGRIDGKEPGQPIVRLTQLKRDNAAKSWLFDKYYQMEFVDKNPEGDADDEPLDDESLWERTCVSCLFDSHHAHHTHMHSHSTIDRVIKDIVWCRRQGYVVETALRGGGVSNQSIQIYDINVTLHDMIRDSPHNTRVMASTRASTQPDGV